MSENSDLELFDAVQAFRTARLQATAEQIWAALTGKSADLLSYDEVRKMVHARESASRELKEVPLEAIVGSVGRHNDFTRRFMPLKEDDRLRWARVRQQMEGMRGVPPIDLYQIGEVYFVRDGNHRVSIAREMDLKVIEAYVTKVYSKVNLTPDMEPDDIILKARYANFLNETQLDKIDSDIDLNMTVAGQYRHLLEEIKVHQEWMDREKGEKNSFFTAAHDWYYTRYLPVIQVIRHRGLMWDFPDRLETDVYVWLQEHRQELQEHLGWSVDADNAAMDFVYRYSRKPEKTLGRMGAKIKGLLVPKMLETGPAPGKWREMWQENRDDTRMFGHILVAVNGRADGWLALEQAISIAKAEPAHIYGLHIAPNQEAIDAEPARQIHAEFEKRCTEAGVGYQMSVTSGPITSTICYRARWADLVVVSLAHPPGDKVADRLGSKFSQLLRRCPRPVLAVPNTTAPLTRLLLAYDGSPKANEALFVAAHAGVQWRTSLIVLTVQTDEVAESIIEQARIYLADRNCIASFITETGDAAGAILHTARSNNCDLVIMGGYAQQFPGAGIVAGSVVDELLRKRNRPVLVCR